MTFITDVYLGKAHLLDVDNYVKYWRENEVANKSLEDCLGFEDYHHYIINPKLPIKYWSPYSNKSVSHFEEVLDSWYQKTEAKEDFLELHYSLADESGPDVLTKVTSKVFNINYIREFYISKKGALWFLRLSLFDFALAKKTEDLKNSEIMRQYSNLTIQKLMMYYKGFDYYRCLQFMEFAKTN